MHYYQMIFFDCRWCLSSSYTYYNTTAMDDDRFVIEEKFVVGFLGFVLANTTCNIPFQRIIRTTCTCMHKISTVHDDLFFSSLFTDVYLWMNWEWMNEWLIHWIINLSSPPFLFLLYQHFQQTTALIINHTKYTFYCCLIS